MPRLPMSLADACLVRLSEILDDVAVVTRAADFRVCRRHRLLVVALILLAGNWRPDRRARLAKEVRLEVA